MEKEIEHLRGELSILIELERGISVNGKMCRKLKRKYKLNKENITTVKETVKQRIRLKAQRMGRYEKLGKFYHQNLIFKNDGKKFYREIEKEKLTVNETPAINDIGRFLDTILSEEKDFNENSEWIKNVHTDNANIHQQQWSDISVKELQAALKRSHKWTSAEIGQVSYYWLNSLYKGHYILVSLYKGHYILVSLLSATSKNLEESAT